MIYLLEEILFKILFLSVYEYKNMRVSLSVLKGFNKED